MPPDDGPSAEKVMAAHFMEGRLASTIMDGPHATIPAVDPSTGRTIAEVPIADAHDIDRAVAVAVAAQPAWAKRPVGERILLLQQLIDELARRRDDFALLDSMDSGNPLRACLNDVDDIVRYFEHWAAMARTVNLHRYGWERSGLHYDDPLPYGVVLRIAAYNKPLYFAAGGALMPLLMGNGAIVKPAPQSPLSALAFGQLAAKWLPDGLLAVLPGDRTTGSLLVAHPALRRIAFTGSAATGRAIQRACADSGHVKTLTMELGGKNALVVLPDADLDRAADAVVAGSSLRTTGGQSCQATSRVLVHQSVYDEVLDLVCERLAALRIGIAYLPGTEVGPLISQQRRDAVRQAVTVGLKEGARLRFDGASLSLPTEGYFQPPVLLDRVHPTMWVGQEEIFGPVLCASSFISTDEAVDVANSVSYGLTASVWTRDIDRAFSIASRLEAGYVWVNDVSRHYVGTPFGGLKDSGVGREESEDSLISFVQQRVIHVKFHDFDQNFASGRPQ